MMIRPSDAGATQRAMLRPGWFGEHACPAGDVWMEELEVVGVLRHLLRVVFGRDDVLRCGGRAVGEV